MKRKEAERLMEKFKISQLSGGTWGDGYLEALQFAEKFYEKKRKKVK